MKPTLLVLAAEMEILSSELLESILISGQHIDLFVHLMYLLTINLDLLFLLPDLESGSYPTQYAIVTSEANDDNEHCCSKNGIVEERTLLGIIVKNSIRLRSKILIEQRINQDKPV